MTEIKNEIIKTIINNNNMLLLLIASEYSLDNMKDVLIEQLLAIANLSAKITALET